MIKKYKSDKIELFLTNNFLSEDSIQNINKPNSINVINDKINNLIGIPLYETSSYDLIHNKKYTEKKYEGTITTWISLLIKEKTILKFENIDKKFNLKQGSILLFSVFDINCNMNKNILFKTSKPIYYKRFFKLI